MKTLNNEQAKKGVDFLKSLNIQFDVFDYIGIAEIDLENAYDSITEKLDDNNAFNIDIIYYSNAIEYLKENDPSLKESLEIASELGYSLENLSSEVLASLLASQNAREEWGELENEINDFFLELFEELDEEED